ncbi:hypothetical protein F0L68_35115 [Solihabitans fulvus]|uniref:RNA polymerase-binding protein RbpA n=1 Tax=Solihabitans fulvus TaxID=1892852 RepID=A0A5B2WME2_9PSEU|nr:RNA polymerase-binding protein RbpA [Solihabitans fulvus]KAA2252605.1 hypothetical protein F0L68_35115 [Solihabitans fulvus]
MQREALSGYRLGSVSHEPDRDTDLAPRRPVEFACPKGHAFTVQFAVDADLPTIWSCRRHGDAECVRTDGTKPESGVDREVRTHWVLFTERRSPEAMAELLAETLVAVDRARRCVTTPVLIGGRRYGFRYQPQGGSSVGG